MHRSPYDHFNKFDAIRTEDYDKKLHHNPIHHRGYQAYGAPIKPKAFRSL